MFIYVGVGTLNLDLCSLWTVGICFPNKMPQIYMYLSCYSCTDCLGAHSSRHYYNEIFHSPPVEYTDNIHVDTGGTLVCHQQHEPIDQAVFM